MLAVSGVGLVVLEPTGEDELFVLETPLAPLPAMVELGRRVTCTEHGTPVDWSTLPAADVGAAALLIRRSWLGDAIRMGKEEGMQDFTESLRQLVVAEKIDRATAFEFAPSVEVLKMALKGITMNQPGIL